MKTLSPNDLAAALALAGMGVGTLLIVGAIAGVVAGMGAAVFLVSALVLIYLIAPDHSPGGPPQ